MDAYKANVIEQFLEANWNDFEVHCKELEEDATEIAKELEEIINAG